MAFETHPAIKTPGPNTVIWRYMDLQKFISLISHSGLYFCRADRLGDPHEGSTAIEVVEERADRLASRLLQMDPKDVIQQILPSLRSEAAQGAGFNPSSFRDYVLVNCWYRSQHESDAMWRIYAQAGPGVAIKTTVRRLSQSLCCDESVFIGAVRYDDHRGPVHQNELLKLLSKRKAFSHERELRAISIIQLRSPTNPFEIVRPEWWMRGENGTELCVDIDRLIMEILVSPSAPEWYRDVVSHVCYAVGLANRVKQSEMASFTSTVNADWEAHRIAARKVGTALRVRLLPGGAVEWRTDAEARS